MPALIALAALLAAFLAGAALAFDVPMGLALLAAFAYAPLVLVNLPLGIILWLPLAFLTNVTVLRFGPTLAGLLILFAWVGTLAGRNSRTLELVRRHRGYLLLAGAFLLWMVLSLAWSKKSAFGNDIFVNWVGAVLVYIVLSTTLTSPRHMRLAAAAFVFGAVVSAAVGLVESGLQSDETALQTASAEEEERLAGGAGDPNYLAAGIIPGVLLALGLWASTRRVLVRLAAAVSLMALAVGFAAAESRGGLVAAAVAGIAGFIFFKRRRLQLLVAVLSVIGITAIFFSVNPDAWERISSFDTSGTGRTELWDIAWEIGKDRPVVGVGIENFVEEAPRYADQAGALEHANFIAEEPHVAHNVYLQLLAELGVVGLGLFLAVAYASLRAALLAARRFELSGDRAMASLARSLLVAGLAALAAGFFLSNGYDRRTWILFALGPALLALAERRAPLGLPEGAIPASSTAARHVNGDPFRGPRQALPVRPGR